MSRALVAAALWLLMTAPCPASSALEWGVAMLEVGSSREAAGERVALRGALELMGIPFRATSSVQDATRHSLVLVGGLLHNTELAPQEREALYAYVERGGVLLATQVQGNKFFPLFGLEDATPSKTNFEVAFAAAPDPVLRYLNRPEERRVSLGNPEVYSETVWSTEYTPAPGARVLARYANGAAALTVRSYGRGLAYALGLGFKETTMIPQLAVSFGAERQWINAFEPSGDVFRLLLRALYEDSVHPFVQVHTVPDGRGTALVLSHDVDARESFQNSLTFAEMEASLGVRSTFFVTTKYFADSTDIGYYDDERAGWIRRVREAGFEVGSHSVSHSRVFDEFPVGSSDVDRASYRFEEPTLFGEVRVSKELLDRDIGQRTVGFRAGYLRYPSSLLRVLEESGYAFDSSVSAQWVLTNFPYFGFRRRSLDAEHSQIVVVPVTLDDSVGFLTPETQEDALRVWTEVIQANAENGAITTLLIHPTDVTYKLETERRLIEAHRGDDVWIGDVGSLARFWRERARLRPELRVGKDGSATIVLNWPRAELPSHQTLVVEAGSGAPPRVTDSLGEPVPVAVRLAGDRILLRLP